MAKAEIKSLRGQPEIYDEVKHRYTMCLTPSTSELLSAIAEILGISRSELLEQLVRGTLPIADFENAQAQVLRSKSFA